jgi:hypothetical protein
VVKNLKKMILINKELTGHVICNHEDDLAVWNAQSLDTSVD